MVGVFGCGSPKRNLGGDAHGGAGGSSGIAGTSGDQSIGGRLHSGGEGGAADEAGSTGDAGSGACSDMMCAGGCVDTTNDPKHCGSCEHDCLAGQNLKPSATATCVDSKCVLGPTPCAAPYADCNQNSDDGCELAINTVDACLACGQKCSAGQVCDSTGCSTTCSGTTKLCGTSCIEVSNSPEHCGSCEKACPLPLSGAATGSASCANSACGIACKASYKQCGSSCVAGCASNSVCSGETCGCPANAPVLDNGLCCPSGQQNCGGVCVACAAGSVCSGTTCGCAASTQQCVAPVPNGWLGPVAADLSGQNTACAATYPTSIATGTAPQGAAATCNCSCGACGGGQCDVHMQQFSGTSDCSGTPTNEFSLGTAVNQCSLGFPNSALWVAKGIGSGSGAICAVNNSNPSIGAAVWGTNTRLCTGASTTPGACSGAQLCAPSVASPKKTCVYTAGTATCPAGYPVQSSQYSIFADNRGCTCTCDVQTVSCAPSVTIIDSGPGNCSGQSSSTLSTCDIAQQGSTHGFKITAMNLSVTGKTTPHPAGAVSAASPLTVCCTN